MRKFMDIQLLLQGKSCSCGRRHTCAIDSVIIEKSNNKAFSALIWMNYDFWEKEK
jgi:hypothetical protein